jgi:tetratricopeptide (TPR) repeat protein
MRLSCLSVLVFFGLAVLAGGCASRGRDPSAGTAVAEDAGPDRGGRRSEADAQRLAQAHALFIQALLHDRDGESDQATEKLDAAFRLDPFDPLLALELARRLERMTNHDRALEVLRIATRNAPTSEVLFARMGGIYLAQGKTNLALQAGEDAIKANPVSLAGYQNVYVLRMRAGETNQAWKVLERASDVPEAPADFLTDLAEMFTSYGRQIPPRAGDCRTRAIGLLDRAAALHPTNETVILKIADGYYLFDEHAKALPLYERLLEGSGFSDFFRANVRARLTAIHLHSGHRKKAAEQLKAILGDDPSNVQAYLQLSQIAIEEKKYAEAADYLKKALLFRPEAEPAYYDLAALQLEADDARSALDTLERARNRFSQSFRGEYLAALAFTRLKDYKDALTHFTAAEVIAGATATNQLTHFFYFQMGAAYERSGDIKGAERCFLKSLDQSPEFAEALNYLGYMWADRGENLERAREMIERALKQQPENEAFVDSLGWVLYRQGKLAEALVHLEKAAGLSSEPDPEILSHLGEVYQKLGRVDKAVEAWKKSLAAQPNEELRKKLEALERP